ncbi:MAG: ferrochelatase [Pseudomonadota bacterium]
MNDGINLVQKPADHPHINDDKVGVLLINLGTPEQLNARGVRRWLCEFLSDKRVIERNSLIRSFFWKALLYGVIAPLRAPAVAANYRKIRDPETGESPLRAITIRQAAALEQDFADPRILVRPAMRYGVPSIASALDDLDKAGCKRILAIALYPQYSATTTASAYDALFSQLQMQRWQPAIRTVAPYHDHPAYIDALIACLRPRLEHERSECLLLSFHGLPKRYFMAGDPYHCHSVKTARLVATRLIAEALPELRVELAFQSRFGRSEWLKPYASDRIRELAQSGIKRIAVACPGFAADCLETLEEVAIELRSEFLDSGGEAFTYIPCLNDSEPARKLHLALTQSNLAGWMS